MHIDKTRKRKTYKGYSLKIFLESNIPVDTIIDVGVKTKTPSLITRFPSAKHYLIEPVKEFCEKIPSNYHGVDYEIINKAAYSSSGSFKLGVRSNYGDSISHSSLEAFTDRDEIREMEAITVDDLVAKKNIDPTRTILKVDVDGNDIEVLKGASKTLENIVAVIAETSVYEMTEMFSLINQYPLFLWDICEPIYYKRKMVQLDAFFIHRRHINNPQLNPWQDGDFDMDKWIITH